MTAADDELLARARAMDDEFMRGQVEAFHARRGGPVSAATCPDCHKLGATAAEHVKIHEGLDGGGRVISR